MIFALLLLVGTAFYLNSWGSYFVCDDYEFLGRINFGNAGDYFRQSWGYGNEYRPLVPYTLALDALLSGDQPLGYHVASTLLQVLNAWLLVMIAIRLGMAKRWSIAGGVLFLLNPAAHEAVLWISDRPGLLSMFFQLLSIRCLMALPGWRRVWRLWASLGCFALALLCYEGSVALPFVVFVLWCGSGIVRQEYKLSHISSYFFVLAGYLAFWFWMFEFHIVRQRQNSVWDAVLSFVQAILHSWHGAYRPEVGMAYLAALGWFFRKRANRQAALWLLVLFLAAYLPFFMSKGFAPRFAYFASGAACLLLAMVLKDLMETDRRIGKAALATVLVFYGIGMQNLIEQWRGAGEIARSVPKELLTLQPNLPAHSRIEIAGVPLMYKHAYVYLTGLQRSVSRAYGEPVEVVQDQAEVCVAAADHHFRYADGRMREVKCKPLEAQALDETRRPATMRR